MTLKQGAFTPTIIDVEASGFGPYSYPIEIGVALDNGDKYCTLILPAPAWTHWDEEAEKWFNRKAEEKAAAAG